MVWQRLGIPSRLHSMKIRQSLLQTSLAVNFLISLPSSLISCIDISFLITPCSTVLAICVSSPVEVKLLAE